MPKNILYSNVKGELSEFTKKRSVVGSLHDFEDASSTHFWVHGYVVDIELGTEFKFEKFFSNLKDAQTYFQQVIKKYSLSEAIIKSCTYNEIQMYA